MARRGKVIVEAHGRAGDNDGGADPLWDAWSATREPREPAWVMPSTAVLALHLRLTGKRKASHQRQLRLPSSRRACGEWLVTATGLGPSLRKCVFFCTAAGRPAHLVSTGAERPPTNRRVPRRALYPRSRLEHMRAVRCHDLLHRAYPIRALMKLGDDHLPRVRQSMFRTCPRRCGFGAGAWGRGFNRDSLDGTTRSSAKPVPHR